MADRQRRTLAHAAGRRWLSVGLGVRGDFTAEKASVLAQHLVEFALAGLSAAAAEARKENSTWK